MAGIDVNLLQISLTSEDDDLFDFLFAIQYVERVNGQLVLVCKGFDGDVEVGFSVRVPSAIEAGLITEEDDVVGINPGGVAHGGVVFKPIGATSLGFVQSLKRRLGVQANPLPPRAESIETTAIPLHDAPVDLTRETVRLKLFYDESSFDDKQGADEELDDEQPDDDQPWEDDRYWEAFLIVDVPEGVIGVQEKDTDYRQALVNILHAAWGET